MENLVIEASKYTPAVDFDSNKNILRISGKSTPENTFEFFAPLIEWIKEYFSSVQTTEIVFNVPYFNSSSSRVFYDIFDLLEDALEAGSSLDIKWEYGSENENGLETGEEFQEDFEALNIKLVEL